MRHTHRRMTHDASGQATLGFAASPEGSRALRRIWRRRLLMGSLVALAVLGAAACDDTESSPGGTATSVSSKTSATAPITASGDAPPTSYRHEVDSKSGNLAAQFKAAATACQRRPDATCLTWLQVVDRARAQLGQALSTHPAPPELSQLDGQLRGVYASITAALQRSIDAFVEADPTQLSVALRNGVDEARALDAVRGQIDAQSTAR